ncbi:MAG: mechanosensitive ion channel family protein [Calditrichia bacterium]
MDIDFNSYLEGVGAWFLTSGLQILLVLVLIVISLKIVRLLSNRFFQALSKGKKDDEFRKRADTLSAVVRYILTVVVIIIGLMMILKELGIEIGPILAAAGVVGLAVGFGAQNLVQDVISGFYILLEDQIRVGDVVNIAGKGGLVEKITLRMTVLRDLAGNVHYVRNGYIDVVTNMTKDYSRYVFEVGVAYREDVDEVIKILREIDEELRKDPEYKDDIIEPLEVMGLDKFGDSAIIIKARTTTKPIKQWRIGREFNRRMKKVFDDRNIEIPFPHVTLYMGQEKDGSAPPMRIEMPENQKIEPANK